MTARPRLTNLAEEQMWQARVDLAAALRYASRLGLSEGVCNHFSAVVPDHPDLYLLNPQGLHWSEMRASDVLVLDTDGKVIEGNHRVEPTAFFIHSRIHKNRPHAKCVLHTHMPYATALCCVEGGKLEWASQNALRFYGRVAYDPNYAGVALDAAEGDRLSSFIDEETRVVFLGAHGVFVVGRDTATAFDDLYFLERACLHQVLAQSTGLPLRLVSQAVCEKVAVQMKEVEEQSYLHFDAIKRILDREEPAYAT